jgi:hypothetical protein
MPYRHDESQCTTREGVVVDVRAMDYLMAYSQQLARSVIWIVPAVKMDRADERSTVDS